MKKRNNAVGFLLAAVSLASVPALLAGCSAAAWKDFVSPRKSGFRSENGWQQGPWTYWFDNERLHVQAKGNFKDNRQDGLWTYWYENGNKEWEGTFAAKRLAGRSTFWYGNGELRAQGLYADGVEEGEWTFWDAEGKIDRVGDYAQGKRTLRWTCFYPDGELKAEGMWLDGSQVGPWHFWSPTGEPSAKEFPLPSGWRLVREDWTDGTPRREGFLFQGQPDGRWVLWHENGQRKLAGEFREGRQTGVWIAWREDGEPLASGAVEDGRTKGPWQVWSSGASTGPGTPRSPSTLDGQIAEWLAEAALPVGTPRPAAKSALPEPDRALLADVEQRPKVPIRAQPWTVSEEESLDYLVTRYTDGVQSARPPAGSSYVARRRTAPPTGDRSRSEELIGNELPCKTFTSAEGGTVNTDDYKGRKVVLVVLRGYAGMVCVYCVTQTKALANAKKKGALDAEVLVVYPGPEDGLPAFLESYKRLSDGEAPPFLRLADPDYRLVEPLGLRGDLAIPTTLILDERGIVRWAYVGSSAEDRPPTCDLIKALADIVSGG